MLKKSKDLSKEGYELIKRFRAGEIKPLKTGIQHLDEQLMGGLLPSTVLGIVARSGHGKTYDLERIEKNIQREDKHNEVIFLKARWEMETFKLLLRDMSETTGKSVKSLLFEPDKEGLDTEILDKVVEEHCGDNIYIQDSAVDADTFGVDVETLIKKYPNKKIVVSIDNLENILNSKGGQKASMDYLLSKVNFLKKSHPFISFIILNQLNQNILLRSDDIRKHRPLESDIYGSDQLLKLCDVVYVKLIPYKIGIHEKFMVFGEEMYPWLEDYKIPAITATTSFDPYGLAFYFYLKVRQPESQKDFKDVQVEVLFTKDGLNEAMGNNNKPKYKQAPTETKPILETPKVGLHNMGDIFGDIEDQVVKDEYDDDNPFK